MEWKRCISQNQELYIPLCLCKNFLGKWKHGRKERCFFFFSDPMHLYKQKITCVAIFSPESVVFKVREKRQFLGGSTSTTGILAWKRCSLEALHPTKTLDFLDETYFLFYFILFFILSMSKLMVEISPNYR